MTDRKEQEMRTEQRATEGDGTMKDSPMIGKRVELVSTSDPYTRLRPGTQGTVEFVDDLGTLFVDWDDGSRLGLVPGEDRYRVLTA